MFLPTNFDNTLTLTEFSYVKEVSKVSLGYTIFSSNYRCSNMSGLQSDLSVFLSLITGTNSFTIYKDERDKIVVNFLCVL